MIYHLRCLGAGTCWAVRRYFGLFALGNVTYLLTLMFIAFMEHEAFPMDKAVLPALIIGIQVLRYLHDHGDQILGNG